MAEIIMADKLLPVLESLNDKMSMQIDKLTSLFDIQKTAFEKADKADKFDGLRDDFPTPEPYNDSFEEKAGSESRLKQILDKLQEMIPTKDLVSKAALLPIIGFFASNFAQRFVTSVLEGIGIDDQETQDLIGSSAKAGIQWGAIGLIFSKRIGGLFAVGGILYNIVDRNFEELSNFFDMEFSNSESLTGSISALVASSFAVIRNTMSGIPTILNRISSAFAPVIDFLSPIASRVGNLLSFISKRLLWPVTVLSAVYDSAKAFIDTEGSFVERSVAGLEALWKNILQPLDLIKSLFAKTVSYLGFEDTASVISSIDITPTLSDMIAGFKSFRNGIVDTANSVLRWFSNGITFTENTLASTGETVNNLVTNSYNSAMSSMNSAFSFAAETFTHENFTNVVRESYDSALNWFTEKFNFMSENLPELNIMDNILSVITDIKEFFEGFIPDISGIQDMVSRMVKNSPLSMLFGNSTVSEVTPEQPQQESFTSRILNNSPLSMLFGNNNVSEREPSQLPMENVATAGNRVNFVSENANPSVSSGQQSGSNLIDSSVRVGGSPNINTTTHNNYYSTNSENGLVRRFLDLF